MVQTSRVQTLGDSLRDLADVVDQVPSLTMAMRHPDLPQQLTILVKTASAVEGIGAVLERPVTVHSASDGQVYTTIQIPCGRVQLHVFAMEEAPRELHRPLEVTEKLAEVEE